jgi:hypothetical protein
MLGDLTVFSEQTIRAGKLEAHPFFILNVKGTPSQEEHKTIFSCLSKIDFVWPK